MNQTPPSLTGRAILAVALMIGFYVLAIGIAVGLIYIPAAMVIVAHEINIRIAAFCIIGAFAIFWSIAPRIDRFLPPGPLLEADDQPRLFKELITVANTVGQPMPTEVYAVNDVNAWVAQRGGFMGLGSRRVMGLGLPLMQILSVSELRAVIAHEFGHYYGGDTKLGPWVYKTRGAIGRTIQQLEQQSALLQKPFLWYGMLFLRITHAISRAQEYAADALAARTVGSKPLTTGLTKIMRAGMAFNSYWSSEVVPLLNEKFRPPLAEGLAKFISAPQVEADLQKFAEKVESEQANNPYLTHPIIQKRVAAIQGLPEVVGELEETSSISLLDGIEKLEIEILNGMANKELTSQLRNISWDDIGEQVYIPLWESMVRKQSEILRGVTCLSLVDSLERFKDNKSLRDLVVPPGQKPSLQEKIRIAVGVFGVALFVGLRDNGWDVKPIAPGLAVALTSGETEIEPFSVVNRIHSKELSPEVWRETCAKANISNLSLEPRCS